MEHVIRILCVTVMAAALAGCTPAEEQQARGAGENAAQQTRAAGREVARESREAGKEIAAGTREAVDDLARKTKDTALAGKVQAALKLRQGLETKRIEVKADAQTGRVILEGSVPDMKQRKSAEEVARTTDGVTGVENRLAVPPAAASAGG